MTVRDFVPLMAEVVSMSCVGDGPFQARQQERTLCRHLPLAVKIALVAHDDHGEVVLVLYSEDLLLECHNLLEALSVGYRVDEQEALAGPHVLLAHRRVFLLASCVEHVEQGDLIIDDTLLAIRV